MNRTIHGLLYTALKALIDMDPELYNKCEQEYEQSCQTKAQDAADRQHRWQIIEIKASKRLHPNHVFEDPVEGTIGVAAQNGPNGGEKKDDMDVDSTAVVGGNIPIHMDAIPEVEEEEKGHPEETDMSMDVTSP